MDPRAHRLHKLRALIIGYGNSVRGDDAFGWHAAEHLASLVEFRANPGVRILTVHQLMPELAEEISGAELIIFFDSKAPSAEDSPGMVHCEEIHAEPTPPQHRGHRLTPANALAYARAFYDANPRAFVLSVTAATFAYGAPLTPEVEATIPMLARWTRERIAAR
jgi:hydrogenase maturation protease